MARVKQKSDLLNFTIFHNEFIETEILSGHEKLVFMAIKRHLNEKTNKSFPSLSTISKYSRLCKSTVQKTLKSLEDKGIIQVKHRQDNKSNGNKSNEYTLYDYKSMWIATNKEEIKQAIEKGQEVEALESLPTENLQRKLKEIQKILEKRNKEKELVSDSDQTADTSPMNYNSSKNNNSTNTKKNQGEVTERYTLNYLKENLYYNDMLLQSPYDKDMVDTFFHYLHGAMNTTKSTIRVNGEQKPREVVLSVLSKLEYFDFLYAVEKYKENTSKVNNQGAYIITLLYNARAQHEADITNQVQHNMYGQD